MTDYILAPVLAKKLGLKTSTLAKWRYQGKGPKGWTHYAPNVVAYPADEVERWLAETGRKAA